MLITFKNHHFWNIEESADPEVSPGMYAYEMVNSDRIIHIYQIMPEQDVICIEYKGHDGVVRKIHERFENKYQASARIFELQRILRGETTK